MTKFDSDSIKNKIIERLNQDKNWQAITSNSAITALINSQAEASAEIARYAEYLFKESRWDTAQNESSILSMANMLGYQPKRKISATGKITLSSDKTIHSIGSTKSYDTATLEDLTPISTTVNINRGQSIKINNIDYVIGQAYTITSGSKYLSDVTVIQGNGKELHISREKILSTYTKSKLNSYIYIPFYCSNVEDASSSNTSSFLRVLVDSQEYRIVENLLLSTSEDRDCELYNDLYSRNLFYLKFRADNDSLNFTSSSFKGITIEYIESKGKKGNIDSLYKNCDISIGGISLYGITTTPLNNGKDEEDTSSIKENAVSYYRDFYSIGTRENYEKTILKMEFSIGKNYTRIKPEKVKVFSNNDRTKTNVSFISPALEDAETRITYGDETIESQITSQLNKALTRLKSPQDALNFIYPSYYHFGIKCSCKAKSDNTASVSNSIQTSLDNLWGVNSDYIDFDRDFSGTETMYNIRTDNTSAISTISIDAMEAVTQIDWKDAVWETTGKASSVDTHYCKLPFEFKNFFRDKSAQNKGKFFDFTKHNYALRIDFLFRCNNSTLSKKYNKTLLLKLEGTENPDTIFFRKNTSGLWGDSSYTQNIKTCYQLPFQATLISDDDFVTLETKINNGLISKISDTETGSINDITLQLNNKYAETDDKVSGELGIAFDSLYRVLQIFSLYDSTLSNDSTFKDINLSTLQCGTEQASFINFRSIASKRIDIYISVLIDKNTDIVLEDSDTSVNILCIDSYDEKKENLTDLTEYKKNRFITVVSTFEE